MPYLLGVDVGTTHTKAVLFSTRLGRVVRRARIGTPSARPRAGWVEIDPDQLWATVTACIRSVLSDRDPSHVAGLAVASMAEAGAPIDARGRWLYPVISWQDERTEPQAAWLRERFGETELRALTGFAPDRKYSATKLLWLREHEPDRFRQINRWLCVADVVLWKLSDHFATDFTLASRTMLLDQQRRAWSEPLLEALGLSARQLPPIQASGTMVGTVSGAAAAETGLLPGTPIATAGHDHLCGALACGLHRPGPVFASCGTACAVVSLTPSFVSRLADTVDLNCYTWLDGRLYCLATGLPAWGDLMRWLTEVLQLPAGPISRRISAALEQAERVPPGAEGLRYALGDWGVPMNRAMADVGAFTGLRMHHGVGHLMRAALESLASWLAESVEAIEREAGSTNRSDPLIQIGGAVWPLHTQIIADLLRRPIHLPELRDETAVGAALLAGVAAGVFPSLEAAAASVTRPVRSVSALLV